MVRMAMGSIKKEVPLYDALNIARRRLLDPARLNGRKIEDINANVWNELGHRDTSYYHSIERTFLHNVASSIVKVARHAPRDAKYSYETVKNNISKPVPISTDWSVAMLPGVVGQLVTTGRGTVEAKSVTGTVLEIDLSIPAFGCMAPAIALFMAIYGTYAGEVREETTIPMPFTMDQLRVQTLVDQMLGPEAERSLREDGFLESEIISAKRKLPRLQQELKSDEANRWRGSVFPEVQADAYIPNTFFRRSFESVRAMLSSASVDSIQIEHILGVLKEIVASQVMASTTRLIRQLRWDAQLLRKEFNLITLESTPGLVVGVFYDFRVFTTPKRT
jgi:hypothetical protein